MPKFLIATYNPGKLKEIQTILKSIPFRIISLAEVGVIEEIPETGETFEENAVQKARFIGEKTGFLTLADDSGLEVDYLDGRPGVRSARYISGSDEDRVNQVLRELNEVPLENRGAKFVAVVALYNPVTKSVKTWRGESLGRITEKAVGRGGFGYDPGFYNFDLGKTNAEATPEEKNKVSHRSKALQQTRIFLK